MAKFMDVHSRFVGVTAQQLQEAHDRDRAIATGPSHEAVTRIHARVGHPTAEGYELPVVTA
jgi:hypothetical protein